MLHWLRYPFLRITPAFAVGILLFDLLDRPGISHVYLAILFIFVLIFFLLIKKRFFSLNPFAGSIVLTTLVFYGLIYTSSIYQLKSPDHFSHKTFNYYQGVVDTWPEERNGFIRTVLHVQYVKDTSWEETSGKVQLYIPRDQADAISYGTVLLVRGKPVESKEPGNLFEFDYKRYLSYKNIFHQQFLNSADFRVVGTEYPSRIKLLSGQVRERATRVLESNIELVSHLGIAKAMLIGDRSGMDVEMKQAYAHTGAMHILAISGLHVGILYGLLALLLAPLKRSRHGKFIFTFIILFILWSYASIVGASPSVMRAVIMFSLITVGQALFRTPDIFNTIAFSAFFLLIIDPFQLFEVGFQLSYLAVVGIVLLYRRINSLISSKYWIINAIWSITSVALAAQLFTFPISLYYFHNFPNLFFLSNLLVIPGATVIVVSGILLLLTSLITSGIVPAIFGKVISFTIGIMNEGVFYIESMPYSHISDVYLTMQMVVILYLLIICGLSVIIMKRVGWMYLLTIVWSVFIIVVTAFEIERHDQQLLMIYNIPGNTVLDHISGGEIQTLVSEGTKNNIGYNTDNFRIAMAGTSKPDTLVQSGVTASGFKISFLGNKSLVWVDQIIKDLPRLPQKMSVDFLLLSNNTVNDIQSLLEIFEPGLIVIDSSNDYFYSKYQTKNLNEKGLEVYSTRQSGGLLIDLKTGLIRSTLN